MIENNLLKTNFLGKDGFRWWIGQVAPEDAQGNQINQIGKAWGARVKVRIYGYHPADEEELPNKDLPWAQVLLSSQGGSGKAGRSKSLRVSPGDTVLGFFLDGDDAQLPVVLGLFASTGQKFGGDKKYKNPFEPFTGYTSKVKPGKFIIKNEDGGQTGKSNQKSPRCVPEELCKKIEQASGFIEVPTSKVIGKIVTVAGGDEMREIQNTIKNGVLIAGNLSPTELLQLKSGMSKKISGIANGLVGPMVSNTFKDLAPVLNDGLAGLYKRVYTNVLAATKNSAIAKKAGTAAQSSLINPVKALQDKIPCATEAIGESMLGSVSDLLTPLLDNVENYVPCIADQFTGALFNKIIGGIEKEIGPSLGGVGTILGGFDMIGNLRSKAEGLIGITEALKCITPDDTSKESNFWVIGKGATNVAGVTAETILGVANIAREIQETVGSPQGVLGSLIGDVGTFDFMNTNVSTEGFSSVLGECYTGPPLNCKGVKINVFGGDGQGVDARPIIGALVPDALVGQTGSLIGVELLNQGSGYTVPPIVEVTDNCENGYGAVARAVIDYDPSSPTYQQVTDIYIVSPGENYPVIDDTNRDNYIVDHVVVVKPGTNYSPNDVIKDNEGNIYTSILDTSGRILTVIPPNPKIKNVIPIKNIPELIIETETGSGAIVKPILTPRPEYQGEIIQVIDCITPRDGIVGYINGDPYYGPFHVHPDRGVKMVGVAHTTSPHAIIYDTPAESRAAVAVIASGSSAPTLIAEPTTEYVEPQVVTPTNMTTVTPTQTQTSTPSTPSQPSEDDSGSSGGGQSSGGGESSGGGGGYYGGY